MRFGLILPALSAAMLTGGALAAQSAIHIQRAVFVERSTGEGVSLERASQLRSGDKVVLVMQWNDEKKPQPFLLASRVPSQLAFQQSGADAVEVSVDGGLNWGRIGSLRIGSRLATPEDVTHLRWRIPSREGTGIRSFSAIVR